MAVYLPNSEKGSRKERLVIHDPGHNAQQLADHEDVRQQAPTRCAYTTRQRRWTCSAVLTGLKLSVKRDSKEGQRSNEAGRRVRKERLVRALNFLE